MKLSVVLFVCLLISKSFGWGLTGHRIVGEIAQRHLKKSTARKLKKIMETETLAVASNWPDEIKSDPKLSHSGDWHYVSIPDGQDYSKRVAPEKDVIMTIEEQTQILKDQNSTQIEKRNAIAWLVHLIGDLHQPLHAGRAEDRGGNDIKLNWFGEATNLHRIWDSNMIDSEKMSFKDYSDVIDTSSRKQIKEIQEATLMDMVNEGVALRAQVYENVSTNKYWEYNYKFHNLKTLNSRLYKGGYRLAKWLEDALK